MSVNVSSTFSTLAEYRKHINQCIRYSYSQYGHIFAPSLHRIGNENSRRDTLDEYMRHLYMMPFGAVLLQLEVQGNRVIDQAFADGTVYELGGIWATRVNTETFSYYTTEEAEGTEEWLPFLLNEVYIDRQGNAKSKSNQKALNLYFKKPLEGEVIEEVETRFQRWLNPVLDMFRRHHEARETIEGQMILNFYFEYASSIRQVLRQYQGEDKAAVRAEQIESLMDQFLLDAENVRLTGRERSYTSAEVIAAARRAIHNFCIEQNRRIVELLGSKKTVSMFLEGMSSPTVVYHTNTNPNDWRSPMLPAHRLEKVGEACFLKLAMNDQQRSRGRMDEKASMTYAPVAHAETKRAQAIVQDEYVDADQHGSDDDSVSEPLPFGLSFGGDADDEGDAGLTLTDVMVTQGSVVVPYAKASLKSVRYVAIGLEGDGFSVVHRWETLQEATQSLRETQARLSQPEQIEALHERVKLLHDPQGVLGAEGSTQLLRTLDRSLKGQLDQGDRYWTEWAVVEQVGDGEQAQKLLRVKKRFTNAADAALLMQETLQLQKQQLGVESFKSKARCLKAVHDPEGALGATDTTRPAKGVPRVLLAQMENPHYVISRGEVVIRIPHLDADLAESVDNALAEAAINRFRQAKAAVGNAPETVKF